MVDQHTVRAYDKDLDLLERRIAEMGGIAEKMVIEAMDALSGSDATLAHKVIACDDRLDTLQREIEELIDELSGDYTIAIVTHNMQQAARCSRYTAFMYLGEMVEFNETDKIFTSPRDKRAQDYITGRFG